MSDSAAFMTMASTDLAQAQTIFSQVAADKQALSAEEWVMMTETQSFKRGALPPVDRRPVAA